MWTLIGSLKCQHRTIGVKIPLQNIPSTNNCINSRNSSWYHTTNSWKQSSWELLRRSLMSMPRGKFRRVLGQGRENVHGRVLTCLLVDFGDLPRFQSWSNLSSFPFETMLSEIRRAKQPDRDPIAIGIRFFIFTNCILWGFFWKFCFSKIWILCILEAD